MGALNKHYVYMQGLLKISAGFSKHLICRLVSNLQTYEHCNFEPESRVAFQEVNSSKYHNMIHANSS